MSGCGCGCSLEAKNAQERATLRAVLLINAIMFTVEFGLGLVADSTGLVADSLDMLADALVYAISLYAVGKSAELKNTAARFSGLTQISLASLVVIDVLRRFILGSEPVSLLMMSVGVLALAANATCLLLLQKHRHDGVHMRASLIFSANDVIANAGVILSGLLVWITTSNVPDLLIGVIIALLVARGGLRIMREARAERQTQTDSPF